jgi:hypothetical protein
VIAESQINDWFTYHSPTQDQIPVYEAIRSHGREFAHVINNLVPDGADKTHALRTLRSVVMWANAAVATTPPTEPAPTRQPVGLPDAPGGTYQTATGFTSGRHLKDDEIVSEKLVTVDDMVNSFVGKLA